MMDPIGERPTIVAIVWNWFNDGESSRSPFVRLDELTAGFERPVLSVSKGSDEWNGVEYMELFCSRLPGGRHGMCRMRVHDMRIGEHIAEHKIVRDMHLAGPNRSGVVLH